MLEETLKHLMTVGAISQLEPDKLDDTIREYKYGFKLHCAGDEIGRPYVHGARLHCAGGDVEVTLRMLMEPIMQKIKELNTQDGGERKIRYDFAWGGRGEG